MARPIIDPDTSDDPTPDWVAQHEAELAAMAGRQGSLAVQDVPRWALPPAYEPLDVRFRPLADAYRRGGSQDFSIGDMDVRNPTFDKVQPIDTPPNSRDLGIDAKEAGLAARSVFKYDPLAGARPPKEDTGYHPQPDVTIGKALEPVSRALNAGSSALDILTVNADKLIPGPGQGTVSGRFDQYRTQGMAPDEAANAALRDYGEALGQFAETPSASGDLGALVSRGVAQGARVAGTAEGLLAPAPVPGGTVLPVGAGFLKMGARAAVKKAAEGVPLDAEQLAARLGATSPAQRAVVDDLARQIAEKERLANIGQAVEAEHLGAKQSAADKIVEMQQAPGQMQNATPLAEQRFGGKPELGFQSETFSPESQPVLDAAKQQLAGEIAPKVAPISQQDTLLAAQMTGRSVEDAARMLPKRGQLSTTVVEVAQGIEAKIAQADAAATKLAAQGGGALTMAERLDALLAMKEAGATLADFAEGSSEIGRALNARKIAIQRDLANNPSEAAYRAALQKIMGPGADPAKADALLAQLALIRGDAPATYKLLRSLNTSSFWDKAFEYSQGNILWAAPTHLTNTYSGLTQQALLTARTLIEPAVQASLSGVVAKIARRNYERSREFSDIVPAASGYIDGLQKVANTTYNLVTRRTSLDEAGGFAAKHGGESIRPGGAIPGRVGDIARAPFAALTVEDLWQTTPMFNAELRRLASQQARGEGLNPLKNNAAWRNRVDAIVMDPPIKMEQAARDVAENYALHSRGKGLEETTTFVHSMPGLRYIVRFTTTPTNVVKLGIRHSPFGLTRLLYERGNAAQVITESAAIGGVALGYFWSLIESGQMTGLTPATKTERDLWQAEGVGPMMVRSADVPVFGALQNLPPFNQNGDASKRWVTAGIFGPAIVPAMIAAAIRQAHSDGSEPSDKQVQAALGAMVRTFADQVPMLQGIHTVQSLIDNPKQAGTNLLGSTLKTFLPAAALEAMVERMSDTYKRNPDGLLQEVQAAIPFLAQNGIDFGPIHVAAVPTELDVFGRPVKQNTGLTALFPRGSEDLPPHPVLEENKRLRAVVDSFTGLTKTGSKAGNTSLSPDEAHRYQELAGQESERRLGTLLRSTLYQGSSETDKAKLFANAIALARKSAQQTLANEFIGSIILPDGSGAIVERTPQDKARGVSLMLGTTDQPTKTAPNSGNTARAEIIYGWTQKMQNDPAFTQELANQLPKGGPTLQEYQQAYPLIKQVQAMPRFANQYGAAIGDEKIWKQYDDERKRYDQISSPVEKSAFLITHPILAEYRKYSPQNPIKSAFLKANPILAKFPLPD